MHKIHHTRSYSSYSYSYAGCVWEGGGIPEADYIIIIICIIWILRVVYQRTVASEIK
jgi:hypothetical protein